MNALLVFFLLTVHAAPTAPTKNDLDTLYPELERWYFDLHQTPELSKQEVNTAAKLATALKRLGFEVTTGLGGTGVVGVLKNGPGPMLMLRTDMDALPTVERTGLPYASRVTTVDASGAKVGVMHACGHDVNMTSWLGAATLLSRMKDRWSGTLMMVGQPAEEIGYGAKAMMAAGLFAKGKPDYALMIHPTAEFAAGSVALAAGFMTANVDTVDITLFGRGGHGSRPQDAVDPIVIAARTVLTLQTIVSREQDPLEPAVITVGAIHGGTKSNIIPDDVKLQITVRSYSPVVRVRLLESIRRVAKGEALAGNAPKAPDVVVEEGSPSTYNAPVIVEPLTRALRAALGPDNVKTAKPQMVAEDFSEYGKAGVPLTLVWLGAAEPKAYAQAQAEGRALPSIHSALFAPDAPAALRTGTAVFTAAALEFLPKRPQLP